MGNKLETNKRRKKDALYNTAFELFTTKGINKTTISDIVEKAGVAKGTFYLYFTDKYDVRNKLIANKAGKLFLEALNALAQEDITEFDEQLLFIADHIINQLNEDKPLLRFISKNLSWGIFKKAIDTKLPDEEYNIYDIYFKMVSDSPRKYKSPELMLFTIVELISSTCYSCILYKEPVSIEEYKPHLYNTIRCILQVFSGNE